MSRAIKLPHCRKFPPRISQEDLKAKTTEVMKEKGANYHYQAEFYKATSEEVVGSPDPKVCTLQPRIREHDEEAWMNAYELVYEFLKEHNMQITLDTMKVEFGDAGEPKLQGTYEAAMDDEFIELKEISAGLKDLDFKQRVDEFASE